MLTGVWAVRKYMYKLTRLAALALRFMSNTAGNKQYNEIVWYRSTATDSNILTLNWIDLHLQKRYVAQEKE